MSEHEEPVASPGRLGGASQLADGWRWRALAAGAGTDVASMQAAALRLRSELAGLDLGTSLRALAAVAEGSHAVARLLQADTEAVRLLERAGVAVPDEILVAFPAEAGAVRAVVGPDPGSWVLEGTQTRTVHPAAAGWGLVVASTAEGDRLFLVRLTGPGVVPDRAPPRTIGPEDPNGPVRFSAVAATPVETAAWWAEQRESFDAILRDAACWFGSCVWLCRAVEATIAARTDPTDQLRTGRVDVWVFSARLAIRDAITVVEPDPTSPVAELAARRAAAVTATTVDTVVRLVALLSDARVSKEDVLLPSRVAQLQIALRRFDSEANLRALGRLATDGVSSAPARAEPLAFERVFD